MRIGVFGYNFPHWKTERGLYHLFMGRMDVRAVYLQNWRELSIRRSRRIAPHHEDLHDPIAVAGRFGFPVRVVDDHDDPRVVEDIYLRSLDVGVILGARILKGPTIAAFRVGILNMHPGLIPDNRGLDNIKWAIVQGIPQGVTAHLIDERVDMGRIVDRQIVRVHPDDTIGEVVIRVAETEQTMMLCALATMAGDHWGAVEVTDPGTYHGAVPGEVDADLERAFFDYRRRYGDVVDLYESGRAPAVIRSE